MAVGGNILALTHRRGFGGLGAVGCDASCRFSVEGGYGGVVACPGKQRLNGGRRFPVGGAAVPAADAGQPCGRLQRACWSGAARGERERGGRRWLGTHAGGQVARGGGGRGLEGGRGREPKEEERWGGKEGGKRKKRKEKKKRRKGIRK
jgi:hypothetical protein